MITDRYIKMCEMAEEIQKEWKPKIRDNCITLTSFPHIGKITDIFTDVDNLIVYTLHRVQMHYGINEANEEEYQIQVSQIDPQDQNYEEEYYTKSIQEGLLQRIYKAEYNKIWTDEKWETIK